MGPFKDIAVEKTGHVALIEIRRPPNNFFDIALIQEIAAALEALDEDVECRAIVLAAQGKAFCAGANFGDGSAFNKDGQRPDERDAVVHHLYIEAIRLFQTKKPIIAAVHGAAVGGGLGLSMVADFRIACPETRFAANFTRLGFHPGFGLTVTLPAVIGQTKAAMMFYTSRRVTGEEAHAMGLADILVPQDQVRTRRWSSPPKSRPIRRSGSFPPAPPCAPGWPTACTPQRNTNLRNSRACARQTISRKASKPPPNGAYQTSPGASAR